MISVDEKQGTLHSTGIKVCTPCWQHQKPSVVNKRIKEVFDIDRPEIVGYLVVSDVDGTPHENDRRNQYI